MIIDNIYLIIHYLSTKIAIFHTFVACTSLRNQNRALISPLSPLGRSGAIGFNSQSPVRYLDRESKSAFNDIKLREIAVKLVLETKDIVKHFGKVYANQKVSIKLYEREILGLLGENGAGKSTLMNVLYGLYHPNSGQIYLHGKEVRFHSPKDAIRQGLGMVHQHFMLVETLTVTENIILGSEPAAGGIIKQHEAHKQIANLSRSYGLRVDPDAKIENLSVGEQQRVEILKALYRQAQILILDEPTAVLTPQEVEEFFKVIHQLRSQGISVIIITHKLEEVKRITDRVYVMRGGKVVGEEKTAQVTKEHLANLMVGREIVLMVHRQAKGQVSSSASPTFCIEELQVRDDRNLPAIRGVSIDIYPGEIVGIAGVDGNGQRELAETIIGLRSPQKGRLRYNDHDISTLSIRKRIQKKMGRVPADRQGTGLVLPMLVQENMVIGIHNHPPYSNFWRLNYESFQKNATELVGAFDIRPPDPAIRAAHLSGGNQQKVILAREFSRQPQFLLISQPTRGLDVGAIEYIHERILQMSEQQVAILLISLELEEILALSDRILVLRKGEIIKEFNSKEATAQKIGSYMTGGQE